MKKITAVVADDEQILRQGITRLLDRLWPQLDIVGQAVNGLEAESLIKEKRPDIAFLDIQMPGKTGVEVAKQISGICRVVFITAYDQYAVQAFENEAVDYLLKPVTEQRLQKTISRLKGYLENTGVNIVPDERLEKVIQVLENRQQPDYLRLVKVKTGADIRFVPVARILFFKAEDKYTIVRTFEQEHLIRTPIKELSELLDPKQFWQVHRSSIVNIDKISVIKRSFTNQMMIGFEGVGQTIPVSRSYEHLFKQM